MLPSRARFGPGNVGHMFVISLKIRVHTPMCCLGGGREAGHRTLWRTTMYRLNEERLVTSSDQETRSNVIDLNSRRRIPLAKRIVPMVSDWPGNVQVAWDLTH